jgi:uncharacterized protein (DUF1330 family)
MDPTPTDRHGNGITLGFIGWADQSSAPAARAFEDEVLTIMATHGGRVLFRGHRSSSEPDTLPAEFHVLWFPDQTALDGYLGDPRRAEIISTYGDVFSLKTSVRLDPLS